MPKIFLIKTRFLQQQRNLLETTKNPEEIDDGEIETGSHSARVGCKSISPSPPTAHRYTDDYIKKLIKPRRLDSLDIGKARREEIDLDQDSSDEPLALVVHRGKHAIFFSFNSSSLLSASYNQYQFCRFTTGSTIRYLTCKFK